MRPSRTFFSVIAWIGFIVMGIKTTITDGMFGVFWIDLVYNVSLLTVGGIVILGLTLFIQSLLRLSTAPFVGMLIVILVAVTAVYAFWIEDIVRQLLLIST